MYEKEVKDGVAVESIIAYPVIRLSEIRANCELINKIIDNATKRLRNDAYDESTREFAELNKAIITLCNAYNHANACRNDVVTKLNDSLAKLEKYNIYYMKHPPCNDEERERCKLIRYNLQKRQEYVIELIRATRKMAANREQIMKAAKEIEDVISHYEAQFANISNVLRC
jgi:hypothetical protein